MNAAEIIRRLSLAPHPEGGHYAETWRHPAGAGSAIYFLLQAGERSAWHRLDVDELWHWYAGAPLTLMLSPDDGRSVESLLLGPDLGARQRPQRLVPANFWQTAESRGQWTLVGCTTTPAFTFAGFTLAPPSWGPGP